MAPSCHASTLNVVNHAHLMPFQEVQALMISYTQMTNNQGNLSHLILTERILSPHTILNSCRTTHENLSHLMPSERISSPPGTLISSMKSRRFRTTFLSFFLSSQENIITATSAPKKTWMIFPTTLLPLFQVMGTHLPSPWHLKGTHHVHPPPPPVKNQRFWGSLEDVFLDNPCPPKDGQNLPRYLRCHLSLGFNEQLNPSSSCEASLPASIKDSWPFSAFSFFVGQIQGNHVGGRA